ncbi:hypothetical protein AA103581_0071 [Gluconobacter wancherniae NBRC 103581]|nr:hypothetical protein AA103581_0071 [Gluconobacter wancherniae NBRC 103581]
MWRDVRYVGSRLVREASAVIQVRFEALRTCVICSKECRSPVFGRKNMDISRARHDVVMRFIRIGAKPIAVLHICIGLGHELHKAHGAGT